MDESQWERLLSQVRRHQADASALLGQWLALPLTPQWEGPAQAAALRQLRHGEELARDLVNALHDAEAQCVDELRRSRALSESARGGMP